MSIPTADPSYTYEPAPTQCNACYAPGETPHLIWLAFHDIQIGQAWAPPDPPPPNLMIEVTVNAACLWTGVSGVWNAARQSDGLFAPITLFDVPFNYAFFHGAGDPCATHVDNDIADGPFVHWFGGFCDVVHPMDSPPESLLDWLADLNIEPADTTWFTDHPFGADLTVQRVDRRFDATNIHILRDLS